MAKQPFQGKYKVLDKPGGEGEPTPHNLPPKAKSWLVEVAISIPNVKTG